MKIVILNGNPDLEHAAFDENLQELARLLQAQNHSVAHFNLKEMDIKNCTGCFDCWVKTPGRCPNKDESPQICSAYIGSDLAVFASPILMGYTSALLKRAQDKLIPLTHPYFKFVEGETHHRARYESYPLIALLLEKGEDADDEDVGIISDIYRRDAINLNTTFVSAWQLNRPLEEIANEINRIQRLPAGHAQ
jgi:multimeric flavodoxin WrbA